MESIRKKVFPLLPSIDKLFLCGGEPTILDTAILIRDTIIQSHYACKIGMNTNGLMFCDGWTDNVDIFYQVSFSLNASNEALYNKIIAKSDFHKIVRNIENFCKKTKDCKHPIDIRATMVVTHDTLFDIYDFCKFAYRLGIQHILLNLEHGDGLSRSINSLSTQQKTALLKVVEETQTFLADKHDSTIQTEILGDMLSSSLPEVMFFGSRNDNNRKHG